MKYFDKNYVIEVFDKSHIFLFYFLFVDDFDIHKNMYKSLKIFYFIFACLLYKKRWKIVNNFLLTLRFHDVNIKDVVEIIRKLIQQFDACTKMNINDVLEQMCAFNMIFFENMFQQIENDEFFQHQINRNCRTCMCIKNQRNNLKYDTIRNDKYHWEILKLRANVVDFVSRNQKTFIKNIVKVAMVLVVCIDSISRISLSRRREYIMWKCQARCSARATFA